LRKKKTNFITNTAPNNLRAGGMGGQKEGKRSGQPPSLLKQKISTIKKPEKEKGSWSRRWRQIRKPSKKKKGGKTNALG